MTARHARLKMPSQRALAGLEAFIPFLDVSISGDDYDNDLRVDGVTDAQLHAGLDWLLHAIDTCKQQRKADGA